MSTDRRRKNPLTIYIDNTEKAAIEQIAEDLGINMSAALRRIFRESSYFKEQQVKVAANFKASE